MEPMLLDAAGHRRSPVTMPDYHRGRPPRNKGCRYPADPPTVDEIVAVMRSAGNGPDAARLRALIVILWRAGLRVSEAPDLSETDLDRADGGILVRRGKGGKRREVGTDRWAWSQLEPWLEIRAELPVGALLCVIHGPMAGRRWEPSAARKRLKRAAATGGHDFKGDISGGQGHRGLTNGHDEAERVTIAYLTVGAALGQRHEVVMWLSVDAVRLAIGRGIEGIEAEGASPFRELRRPRRLGRGARRPLHAQYVEGEGASSCARSASRRAGDESALV